MKLSFIVKCAIGSVTEHSTNGNPVYSYLNAETVSKDVNYNDGVDDWEAWLMIARDTFAPKSGDTVLASWNPVTGEIMQQFPIHQDLFDYVQPVGNAVNEETGTIDGTLNFPLHHNYLGLANRFYGSINPYPDDNQSRRISAFRFETNWAGQFYKRVRFVLTEPFDKNNVPNALAILIYTDPERLNYFYTPGGFIWDAVEQYWYADTTIGQSPTGLAEPVYFNVALGASPLNGGGAIPVDWPDVLTHHSFNWDKNLPPRTVSEFIARLETFGYDVIENGSSLTVNHDLWSMSIDIDSTMAISGEVDVAKPVWLLQSRWNSFVSAVNQTANP